MVLTMVTDAVRPMARPTKVVWMVWPAVEMVTPAGAMMVPTMVLPSSIRAALPTCQNTFLACAPLIKNTRRGVAVSPTVSAAELWKTHTALASPCASSVRSPVVMSNVPPAEVYTAGGNTKPPN